MKSRTVYVVGAGFSAGLKFPTVKDLLPRLWSRIEAAGLDQDLADVIRFHHPDFNPARGSTYPNIETLLSEIEVNARLFDASRPATGKFDSAELIARRQSLMLVLTRWFHDLQSVAVRNPPEWLSALTTRMKEQKAQIVSFNWDLVLDEMLFGKDIDSASYACTKDDKATRLIKPHGSLNWYRDDPGRHIKAEKVFDLFGEEENRVRTFTRFRGVDFREEGLHAIDCSSRLSEGIRSTDISDLRQQTVAVLNTSRKWYLKILTSSCRLFMLASFFGVASITKNRER